MRNYFQIKGHGVNKRGLTVGISFQVTSSDSKHAVAHAMRQAQQEGYSYIRFSQVREVRA